MRDAFYKDDFNEDKNGEQAIKWLVTQERRFNAAETSMSMEEKIHKIMDKIPRRLYHKVQSRMTICNNFGEFRNIFEEVLKQKTYVRKTVAPKREWTWPEGSRPAPRRLVVPEAKDLKKGVFRTCKFKKPSHDFKSCILKSINVIYEQDNGPAEEEENF